MSTNAIFARGAAAVLAATGLLGIAGCEATISTPEPVLTFETGDLVRARFVPPDIYAYPRVLYDDRYVYLVNGYWYMPTARGWFVFRREPVELGRQRTRIYASPRYYPGPEAPYENAPRVRTPEYGYPPPPRYRAPY